MKPENTRRKFLKGSAAAATATAGVLAAPAIVKAQPTVLKMQAAWGGGIFLKNAQSYVERVNAMAGDALQIELLPVNSVVKTSQMQDAVHRGVLDAAHYVPAYWYSKSPVASLFGTGPCFGWSSQEVMGWIYYGGGQELFDEMMENLGLNVISFFNSPMPAQPLGWFKEEIKDASQMNGLKYRTVGLAAEQQAILRYASEAENSNFYWHNTRSYATDLVRLQEESGVNVYRTPDSVMEEQLKAWDIVVARMSEQDPFFAKVIDSQKAYAQEVMNYLNLNQPDYKLAYRHYFG